MQLDSKADLGGLDLQHYVSTWKNQRATRDITDRRGAELFVSSLPWDVLAETLTSTILRAKILICKPVYSTSSARLLLAPNQPFLEQPHQQFPVVHFFSATMAVRVQSLGSAGR